MPYFDDAYVDDIGILWTGVLGFILVFVAEQLGDILQVKYILDTH